MNDFVNAQRNDKRQISKGESRVQKGIAPAPSILSKKSHKSNEPKQHHHSGKYHCVRKFLHNDARRAKPPTVRNGSVGFHAAKVRAAFEADVAPLTPVGTPAVADDPIA